MLSFIDTHCHLLFADHFRYDWVAGLPLLAGGSFGLVDYHRATETLPISGTIFMESGVAEADYQDEARHVAGLVRSGDLMGQIAACRPEIDDGFDDWLAECSGLGVVGLRCVLHVAPDAVSEAPNFRRNLRKIGAVGLAFDLCVQARQLPIALDLASHCDDQAFVLDHCGLPDIAGGAFESWAKDMARLAKLPNVVCKLSGIAGYAGAKFANAKHLQIWSDHVMDCFGPDRVLWGSDWPLVGLGLPLAGWLSLTQTLVAGLSAPEQEAIAQGTARRVYRLPAAPT